MLYVSEQVTKCNEYISVAVGLYDTPRNSNENKWGKFFGLNFLNYQNIFIKCGFLIDIQ